MFANFIVALMKAFYNMLVIKKLLHIYQCLEKIFNNKKLLKRYVEN
jgi:hypothetical protein